MQFVSTRGGMASASFTEILLSGLAPDGGLVVPDSVPVLTTQRLEGWRHLSYADLATEVIGLYATDVPREDLAALTATAYGPDRFPSPVVPLTPLPQVAQGLCLVGLSEGPTMAFKDLAMQFLGQAVPYVLEREQRVLTILGATSGDTGSAAEHAFLGQERVAVLMLSPLGRMSEVQRAQMYSLDDPSIHNIAVDGVFDDCQNLVKEVNADADLKARYSIGAVNSINFGRVAAQVVYYVWAWLRASDALRETEREGFYVDVSVPSGNFGNIYAGHLARLTGVPIRRLILATNENNVLDEFFRTGIYAPRSREDTLATSSPSMDISKASNLERLVHHLLGAEAFTEQWAHLEREGSLDLSSQVDRLCGELGFVSGTSTHADRLAAIRLVHERTGRLIDPHTADGVTVALAQMEPGFPTLVMETAKATKFGQTVAQALGQEPPVGPEIRKLLAREQHVTRIGNDLAELRLLIEQQALRG